MNARELGFGISNCPEVEVALQTGNHACHKVVKWQFDKLNLSGNSIVGSDLQRPEAWTGNLEKAPIIFLASNPSFDSEEAFPDWSGQWSESDITEFATKRFLATAGRPFGATDGPDMKSADRVYLKDGIARTGRTVAYWREIRGRVGEILEKDISEVSADSDYVMTEMVHCKSHAEFGVAESLSFCDKKWTEKILALSPANLVVVMGKKPALKVLDLYPEIPSSWGAWAGRGDWPKSKKELVLRVANGTWTTEQQMKHTTQVVMGGRERTLIWLPRPNSSTPRSLTGEFATVSTEMLKFWRLKINTQGKLDQKLN
jgi:hypothetical protein